MKTITSTYCACKASIQGGEALLLTSWDLLSEIEARCHPSYLTAKAHTKLSRSEAFEGLRIHTDDLNEVIARLAPGTLTIAVV